MAEDAKARTLSLWLVPPEDSELYKTIHSLILTSIPSVYPIAIPPRFTPHVTLTPNTIAESEVLSQAQQWLDQLKLPTNEKFDLTIQQVEVGTIFFQKLIMLCAKTPELQELAAHCRSAGTKSEVAEAKTWISENYKPHCSLMYSDLPQDEVQSKLDEVNSKIQEAKKATRSSTTAKGGSIWLVPTWKDIDEWQPIAKRDKPDVDWKWET